MNKYMLNSSVVIIALRNSVLLCTVIAVVASLGVILRRMDDRIDSIYRSSVPGVYPNKIYRFGKRLFSGSALLRTAGIAILTIMLFMKRRSADLFFRLYRGSSFMRITEEAVINSSIVRWLS